MLRNTVHEVLPEHTLAAAQTASVIAGCKAVSVVRAVKVSVQAANQC